MKTPETMTLPIASDDYDMNNERVTRRTVEQAFASMRSDVVDIRDYTDKPASLSLRRHQFLLMGA